MHYLRELARSGVVGKQPSPDEFVVNGEMSTRWYGVMLSHRGEAQWNCFVKRLRVAMLEDSAALA
jgi:hypothetical protein